MPEFKITEETRVIVNVNPELDVFYVAKLSEFTTIDGKQILIFKRSEGFRNTLAEAVRTIVKGSKKAANAGVSLASALAEAGLSATVQTEAATVQTETPKGGKRKGKSKSEPTEEAHADGSVTQIDIPAVTES